MLRLISFSWILILICLFTQANAQIDYGELKFKHLEVQLSEKTGYCITQDYQGFLWIGTKNGLNRYDGTQVTTYKHKPNDKLSIPSNEIYQVFEDSDKILWIVTKNGLAIYNRDFDSFKTFVHDPNDIFSVPKGSISQTIIEDKNAKIWIITKTVLASYDKTTQKFTKIELPKYGQLPSIDEIHVRSLFIDSSGNFWVAIHNQLYLFNEIEGTFKHVFKGDPNEPNLRLRGFVEDKKNTIWVAAEEGGLLSLNFDGEVVNFNRLPQTTGHNISNIFLDRDGALWISSENRGLFILEQNRESIHFYEPGFPPISPSSVSVQCVYQDHNGRFWIGNYSSGIDYIDPYERQFAHFNRQTLSTLSYNNVSSFLEDSKGALWIATDGGGLNRWDRESNTNLAFQHSDTHDQTIGSNAIMNLSYGHNGLICISNWGGGVTLFDPSDETPNFINLNPNNSGLKSWDVFDAYFNDRSTYYFGTRNHGVAMYQIDTDTWSYLNNSTDTNFNIQNVTVLSADHFGNLWIGSAANGISVARMHSGQLEIIFNFSVDDDLPVGLMSNNIECIYTDQHKSTWIGTDKGLHRFDWTKGTFQVFNTSNGLPDNSIKSIVEDKEGNLWVATLNGLSRLFIDKDQNVLFKNYGLVDGLQDLQFNRNAAFCNSSGDLFFGGGNGFNVIKPSDLTENPYAPATLLTDFKIFNNSIKPGTESHLKKNIGQLNYLELPHTARHFSFDFTALNFCHSEQNQFAYTLEGFDEDWYYIGQNRTATFTNIPSGQYTLRVKAANNDGVWDSEGVALQLKILPPWWNSIWAWIIYILALASIFIMVRKWILRRIAYREKEALLIRQREVDKMKLEFYMNISHEFKTPLTLMLGPLESLLDTQLEPMVRNQLQLINRNTRRLQRLITQLFDVRNTGRQRLELNPDLVKVAPFLQKIFESFKALASQRRITYRLSGDQEESLFLLDRDIIDKALYNILSNAFKYTPDGGKIDLSWVICNGDLSISVRDSGIGISPNEIDLIFQRFYRIDHEAVRSKEGTGIGLSLAKELMEVHKGSITCNSKPGEGSLFSLTIPREFNHQYSPPILLQRDGKSENQADFNTENLFVKSDRSLIFLVDDNKDMRLFLAQEFESKYNIQTFVNGKEALKEAINLVPDLIISDVMMPVMDGLDLCKALRSERTTSHIPIILLTAKSRDQDQISGLNVGADDYICKPFKSKLLRAKVHSLLTNRKLIWEQVSDSESLPLAKFQNGSHDRIFIEDLTNYVQRHLHDSDLNYQSICQEMALSKTQLYRKLKSLTGLSVHDFIKKLRLKKGANLLKNSQETISEIAYMAGFRRASHFSKAFKNQYGKSPSVFRKNH